MSESRERNERHDNKIEYIFDPSKVSGSFTSDEYDLAAGAVIKELSNRSGFDGVLDSIDDDIKEELIGELSKTIAFAIDQWDG